MFPKTLPKNSFIHCGIKTAVHGSEDTKIFCLKCEWAKGRRHLSNDNEIYWGIQEDEEQLEENKVCIYDDQEDDIENDSTEEFYFSLPQAKEIIIIKALAATIAYSLFITFSFQISDMFHIFC